MSDTYVHLDRLRPFSETISATVDVIRLSFKPLLMALLKIAGPWVVVGAVLTAYTEGQSLGEFYSMVFGGSGPLGSSAPTAMLSLGISLFASIASMCALVIAYTTVMIFVLEYHRLQRVPMVDEVRLAVRGVWGRAFGGWFVTILLVAAGLFVLVIPGIYLAIALSMAVVIQFAEGATIGAALKRSMALVKGDWWWAFLFLVLMYICAAIVSFVFEIPGSALLIVEMMTAETAGEALTMFMNIVGIMVRTISNILTICVSAFVAVAVVVLYFREVERTEGGGLLDRIQTVGGEEANTTTTEII